MAWVNPGGIEIEKIESTAYGARLIGGHRTLGVPAPTGRLPLLLRAGAILPLLPAGVDTLSRYADGSTTSLRLARFAKTCSTA